jgi:hypothetical protein
MEYVSFYQYNEAYENTKLLNDYLGKKVERYKIQDRKANRDIHEENYITIDWLKNAFGRPCGSCGDCLTYHIDDNRVESNLTAQRMDNVLSHELNNIVPMCRFCNCSMSNRD